MLDRHHMIQLLVKVRDKVLILHHIDSDTF